MTENETLTERLLANTAVNLHEKQKALRRRLEALREQLTDEEKVRQGRGKGFDEWMWLRTDHYAHCVDELDSIIAELSA